VFIERAEKGQALDMIPVGVRQENVDDERRSVRAAIQDITEFPYARACVEYDRWLISGPNFHTRSIPAVA
jgi:hypothetical protein